MIALIWAQARDAAGRPVIGASGAIPWHVPEDFARFKRLTSGHPVVMGRLTWESLPPRSRPLPGRTNVVVTRQAGWSDDGAIAAGSLEEALALAAEAPGGETVWVIGGGQIYRQALDGGRVGRVEVTDVDVEVVGDAYAPVLDQAVWRLAEPGEFDDAGDARWRESAKDGAPDYRWWSLLPLTAPPGG
ncbi:dihydrofolate reductase [Xylanimonas ulmi]|uniref:Dihydrofolate reductase n=1 Tax=Xylanimonas ulmi TaxID=228973 RepID=A0A4Q7M4Z5_9MICO|nr:dihydrofolate reductase [Xylanibacterium ulmi]RZS62017.1 dihydrofolate reductase [Xylanibacterium ulmi]